MQRRLAVTRHSPQVLHLQDENSNSSDNRGEDGTKEWICRHLGHTRGRTAVHSCLLTPFIVSFSIIKKSWKNFIFIIIFLLKKRHIGKQKVKLLTFSFFFFSVKLHGAQSTFEAAGKPDQREREKKGRCAHRGRKPCRERKEMQGVTIWPSETLCISLSQWEDFYQGTLSTPSKGDLCWAPPRSLNRMSSDFK